MLLKMTADNMVNAYQENWLPTHQPRKKTHRVINNKFTRTLDTFGQDGHKVVFLIFLKLTMKIHLSSTIIKNIVCESLINLFSYKLCK